MKRFIHKILPLLMSVVIVLCIGWFLFQFDPGFTCDFLLRQARWFEEKGNHSAAVWCYDLAYKQSNGSDEVAIELAHQFSSIGNDTKAEYTLLKAIDKGATIELYATLSDLYVRQGKLRDAVLLLDNADWKVRQELASLRPAAPTASLEPGSYEEYLTVALSCVSGTIYVSTDRDYPSAETDAYTGPIRLSEGETSINAVCVGDNGLVSSLATYNYTVHNVVEQVTFLDAALESAVRSQLGLSQEEIIYSDALWEIQELTLPSETRSCGDLKRLQNLRTLTIRDASLYSLDILTDLEHLEELNISGTTLNTDMMISIGSVSGLQRLTLSNCAISSISPLSSLTKLQYLDLSDNAVRDLSGLSAMKNLLYLDLRSNALINLNGLENLTNLVHLDVSYNALSSIQAVENMEALAYLDVSSNILRNLEGVENLSQITHFIARHNELLYVDELKNCHKLVYLDVSNNTLLNVNVTASLLTLQELYFDHNDVTQLPRYSIGCALTTISGSHNQLTSLNSLMGLKFLTYIYMDYNEDLTAISYLADCPKLQEVFVYGTRVKNVSALAEKGIYVVYSPV